MTALTLKPRTDQNTPGRRPVHKGFLAKLAAAKLGRKITVDIPKSVALRGGGVAKGDEAALTVRNRMSTTANYHFRDQTLKSGIRIKSALQDGKLVFWKEVGTPRRSSAVHQTTSKKVAAASSKILKKPKTVAKRKKKAGKTRKAAKA